MKLCFTRLGAHCEDIGYTEYLNTVSETYPSHVTPTSVDCYSIHYQILLESSSPLCVTVYRLHMITMK